jgi:hypothetical protein
LGGSEDGLSMKYSRFERSHIVMRFGTYLTRGVIENFSYSWQLSLVPSGDEDDLMTFCRQ